MTVPADPVVLALCVELMAVIPPAALPFGADIRSAVEKSISSRQVAKWQRLFGAQRLTC
jgi:hypothetical protein